MDSASIVEIGLVTVAFGLASLGIIFGLVRGRLEASLYATADQFIADKLQEVQKQPQLLISVLKPALDALISDYTGQNPGKRPPNLNIAGFKIPPEVYGPVMSQLLPGLLKGGVKKTVEEVVPEILP
jgi:hypothetical protein